MASISIDIQELLERHADLSPSELRKSILNVLNPKKNTQLTISMKALVEKNPAANLRRLRKALHAAYAEVHQDDDPKVKKINAYSEFVKEQIAVLKVEASDMPHKEKMKEVARRWHAMKTAMDDQLPEMSQSKDNCDSDEEETEEMEEEPPASQRTPRRRSASKAAPAGPAKRKR